MIDRYAVIGNPVAHSRSPEIHAAFARATGQQLSYEKLLAPLDAFATTIEAFAVAGGKGVNVTVPFKVEALGLARDLTERATVAGAVNTLRRDADRWFGDNTDGAGLVRDLCDNRGVTLTDREVLVLGAGGAVRGILGPLLATSPRILVVANRTAAKARALATQFASHGSIVATDTEELAGRSFDVIINGTSASLGTADDAAWPSVGFAADGVGYDLVYGSSSSVFQSWAKAQGAARVHDGLGMLIEQAAESFWFWRGIRPDTGPLLALFGASRECRSRTVVKRP